MSLINDLFNAGIIEKQDVIELNKQIEEGGLESKNILEILYRYFMQKITGTSEAGSIFLVIDPVDVQNNENQHNEKSKLKFIKILHEKEIVSDIVFQKIKTFPFTADKSGYFAILHLSRELMFFYYSFTIENQLAYAALLEGKNRYGSDCLLDLKKKDKLIQNIKDGKLETYLDFFEYCYGCRFINILNYHGKEQLLLKEVVKILNQLCYNVFTITKITSYDEDFTGEPEYENKKKTIVINTGAREHRYTYTFWQHENKDVNKLHSLLENILRFTNQLLADFNALYRLTGITNQLSEGVFPDSRVRYAICRFQPENNSILDFYDMQKRFLFNNPSLQFNRFPLSYLHIEYAIYHVKNCGLLAHINGEQYNSIIANVYKNTYVFLADLLSIFPNTIVAVNRTVTPGRKPYLEFLLALNYVSRGVLSFTEIYDGIPDDFTFGSELTFKVSFKCNNEYHEVDCDLTGKEFSDSIVYYIINEIIRKQYAEYRLTQLINSKHTQDIYLFTTKEQNKYLQKMKLREAIDRF